MRAKAAPSTMDAKNAGMGLSVAEPKVNMIYRVKGRFRPNELPINFTVPARGDRIPNNKKQGAMIPSTGIMNNPENPTVP